MKEFISPINIIDLIFIFLGILTHLVLKLNKFVNSKNRNSFSWNIWVKNNWLKTVTSVLCTMVFYVTASHDTTILNWIGINEWTIGNCLIIGFSFDAFVKIFHAKTKVGSDN